MKTSKPLNMKSMICFDVLGRGTVDDNSVFYVDEGLNSMRLRKGINKADIDESEFGFDEEGYFRFISSDPDCVNYRFFGIRNLLD